MNFFLIKAILMSFLPFYRLDFPVEVFPKELTYIEYSQGREVGKKILGAGDASYVALKELFSKNSREWRYDLNTYAPKRLFTSQRININCSDGILVVNYQDKVSEWVQISKNNIVGSCPIVSLESR